MKSVLWYHLKTTRSHLKLVGGSTMPGSVSPLDPPEIPPAVRQGLGSTIAAHLDFGTIITGMIGFSMVFLIQSGVGKLDKMTEQISQLNEKMVSVLIRTEYQDKRDAVQDVHIERHDSRLDILERQKTPASRER